MNGVLAGLAGKLALRLANWPHLVLASHLFMLHTLAFGGWRVPAVRLLWVAALGLFLLWQPFVAGERRISPSQSATLMAVVLVSTWVLGPWLLLTWCGALAAAIGGRAFWTEKRRERSGYLLAFGYLIAITVMGVVPEISEAVRLDATLREIFAMYLPIFLPLLLLFPAHAPQRRTGEFFDLFYGMLVFLVLAVFVLGTLAYMLVSGAGYIESLVKTSMTLAGALLLVAWAWNPRAGISGVGSAISRYLLSVGMPLEQWLVRLSEESERHTDPAAFLDAIMRRLQGMAWVVGVQWSLDGQGRQVGEVSDHRHVVVGSGIELAAYFRYPPSPALRWHVEWLLRLAIEFYLVKRQSEQLRRMGYVQAIYETGARVTHDVKNLLQSLQVLCYAAAQPGDPVEVAGLLSRQLPQIADRLKSTLDKLQSPQTEEVAPVGAELWWQRLRDRYAHETMEWQGGAMGAEPIPGAMFDSVAENLLQNALAKRQREPGLRIEVAFGKDGLIVADNGSAITPEVASALFEAPVGSEDGLGIGLYQAARQSAGMGYRLRLEENRPGRVVFSLKPIR